MGSTVFVIWRESVEAMLVVGLLHSWLKFNDTGNAGQRSLALGVLLGLGLAGGLGWAMVAAQSELSGQALEWFQVSMLLVAAGLMVQMVFWMRRHGATMRQSLHQELAQAAARSGRWGIALVAALAIAREGSEAAVFLYGASLEPGAGGSLALGALLGVAIAALTAWLLSRGLRFLDYRRFFLISGWMLLLFALALLVSAVDRLIGAGLLPALVDPVWNSAWLLDDSRGLGSVLAAMVGYRARPSLTLLLVFAIYAVTVLRALRAPRRHA